MTLEVRRSTYTRAGSCNACSLEEGDGIPARDAIVWIITFNRLEVRLCRKHLIQLRAKAKL